MASTSVLFLDIMFRFICGGSYRNWGIDPGTCRYDGLVYPDSRAIYVDALNRPVDMAKKVELLYVLSVTDDVEERRELRYNIKNAEGCRVLLLDAHVAGPGLSLTGASRIIFCEKFWTPDLEKRVVQCVQQFPQEKPVHVYRFFDEMSDIDLLVKDMIGDKHELIQDDTSFFTRLDTDAVRVPDVPTRGEYALALEEFSENKAAV